jgi:hypothetical protein
MVTYHPHRVASGDSLETGGDAHQEDDSLGIRVLNQVPGWALDKTPPPVKDRDERRPALSPRLVGVRRIA